MEPPATENSDSRRFSARRVGFVAAAAAALFSMGFVTAFLIWMLVGGGVWRGEVGVINAELRSPTRLALIVQSCEGNPEVTVRETDSDVQVEVVASSRPLRGGDDCADTVEVHLQEPLGDRTVVDKHTGQTVSVRRFN